MIPCRHSGLIGSTLLVSMLGLGSSLVGFGAGLDAPWPEFRGPTAQGHAVVRDLPLHWDGVTGTNVAWAVEVDGQGWSSPVLAHGRVYLTAAVEDGQGGGWTFHVRAYEARTGKPVWSREVLRATAGAVPQIHGKNSQASPTPVVDGDRIFAHFGHFGTACVDRDGRVVWATTELKYPPVHGNGGSPLLLGDRLIFNADGGSEPFVAALDKATGRVIWKVPRVTSARKTFSFCTPLAIEWAGKVQVISPGSGLVAGLDPSDGHELWRVRYGEGYSVVPRPVFANGLLFIGTGYDRPTVMAIRPGGAGDVTETHVAWTVVRGAPNTPSMLCVGELLFMVSDAGILSCLEAATGRQVWQERVGGGVSASPVYALGRIYVQTEEGVCVVVRAARVFEKLAENPIGERSLASYAIDENAIFIRGARHLFRVGR